MWSNRSIHLQLVGMENGLVAWDVRQGLAPLDSSYSAIRRRAPWYLFIQRSWKCLSTQLFACGYV